MATRAVEASAAGHGAEPRGKRTDQGEATYLVAIAEVGGLALVGALAPRFGAVSGRTRLDGSRRHQDSVPPPRPGSAAQ